MTFKINIPYLSIMEERAKKIKQFYTKYLNKLFPFIDEVTINYEEFGDISTFWTIGIHIPNYDDMSKNGDEIKQLIQDTQKYLSVKFSNIYFYNKY